MLQRKHLFMLLGAVGLLALVIVVAGFNTYRSSVSTGSSGYDYGLTEPGAVGIAPGMPSRGESADASMPSMPPMPSPESPKGGQTAAEVDQKVIKTGSLQLMVDDVAAMVPEVTTLVGVSGGFVQQSDVVERADGTKYGSMVVRVPAASFETIIGVLKEKAKFVKHETVSGQDVTEQYTDLEAQLRNAQAEERAYVAVLAQAHTVEDILRVQSYLSQIRSQIESLQGRLKYLSNLTSYSTISLFMEEESSIQVPTKEFRPLTTAEAAVQQLIVLAQNLANSLIWLVIVGGGVLIPLLLLAWIVMKVMRRMKRR